MILFDRSKFTWLVIFGVTPPDIHALGAALSVPDESGTGLTIRRPSPDDRSTLPGKVFHKVRLFRQVKGICGPTDLWSVRYR